MTTPNPATAADFEATQANYNATLHRAAAMCIALTQNVADMRRQLRDAQRLEKQLSDYGLPTNDICKPLRKQLGRMQAQLNIAFVALEGSHVNE